MANDLENYYSGDDEWSAFVDVFSERWEECPEPEHLLALLDNAEDIAIVVYGIMGHRAGNWVITAIPALDGLTPLECIKSRRLINRLKTMLMRM